MKITDPMYLEVLTRFAQKHGRNWKSVLYDLWHSGQDAYHADGPALRQIRNHPDRDKVLQMITHKK